MALCVIVIPKVYSGLLPPILWPCLLILHNASVEARGKLCENGVELTHVG
jgi:hypothetical protein